MRKALGRVGSPLVRQLLWRTAAFTLLAFMLLAGGELWFERETERAEVHQRAVHATELALASIEHAVWTYDMPNLRLAVDGLLLESSIAWVRIDTPDESTRMLRPQGLSAGETAGPHWVRILHSPSRAEVLGRIEERVEE